MTHTMIVMIFYSYYIVLIFGPTIHLELKTRKVVFIFDTHIFGGIDSPKKQKKKKTTLVVNEDR